MKTSINIKIVIFLCLLTNLSFSQETLPIYQDYLSDNVFLLHPAAAGVGSCAKIRFTTRSQWAGFKDAPQLQTLSFHMKTNSEGKTGLGLVLFNDNNGYHSQKTIQGTYAYHLELNKGSKINQLSFGLTLAAGLNQIDQTHFTIPDPKVKQIIESEFHIKSDFGLAYHYGGLSSYFTIKNFFLRTKNRISSSYESVNLKNFMFGIGYFFDNNNTIQFEPSLLFQYKEIEKIMDVNIKLYKKFENTQLWLALSYRHTSNDLLSEDAQYISPIIGVNHKKFLFSYTYSKQFNNIALTNKGFHQFSLGYNFLCRKRRSITACPNINNGLF